MDLFHQHKKYKAVLAELDRTRYERYMNGFVPLCDRWEWRMQQRNKKCRGFCYITRLREIFICLLNRITDLLLNLIYVRRVNFMKYFNQYIVTKRIKKKKTLCGDLNLPFGTSCFAKDGGNLL